MDFKFDVDAEYKVKTFEIPLAAVYSLTDQARAHAGFLFGWGRASTAFSEKYFLTEFRINGELDEFNSEEWEEKKDLPGSIDNPFIGLTAGVDYNIFPNVFIGLAVQSVSNFAIDDDYELGNLSLMLSAKYLLNK